MAPYNGPHTIHEPAPLNLSPKRILLTLQQHAHVNGVTSLCTSSAHTLRIGTTRPTSNLGGASPSQHLRSLRDESTADLTDAEFNAFSLHLITQHPKGCFFCQSDAQMLDACTKFQALKADKFASKIVRRFLDPPPSTPSSFSRPPRPSPRPPSPSPSRRRRQLGFDDPSDPEPALEERHSFSDDDSDPEVPDFWDGRH